MHLVLLYLVSLMVSRLDSLAGPIFGMVPHSSTDRYDDRKA
jgi:hypothetical protein